MSTKPNFRTLTLMVAAALMIAAVVGAQTADPRRVEQEIEIMAGILETTVRFALEENLAGADANVEGEKRVSLRLKSIYIGSKPANAVRGYYLRGQGVAFVVKAASSGGRAYADVSRAYAESIQEGSGHPAVGVPIADRFGQQDLHEKLEERQAAVKKRIERAQARTETLKRHLIEALANHGDSMTIVAEDEYVNLMIEQQSSLGFLTGIVLDGRDSGSVGTETLTVRKSWITDYKAGRSTLAEFKQQVLEY